jgi:hypothetical protein
MERETGINRATDKGKNRENAEIKRGGSRETEIVTD